ncbi:MAG TPA: hypothetical protein VFX30_09015 [bacterium]|nr:hypothetical protein [bacterium]
MNVARRCLSRLFLTAVLLAAGASGCTSNALETEPVNLPVPFSGALSTQTRVLVSKGPPLEQGVLFGHLSGKTWEVFDSNGRSVGVVTFELDTATEPVVDGDRRDFSLTVCFSFDDGSSVCADRVAFVDFPFDTQPSVDAANAFPSEPGAVALVTKGVASGTNTSGTQLFVGAVNQTTDHRYVYTWVEHADGVRTFYGHDLCSWFIQGFIGF